MSEVLRLEGCTSTPLGNYLKALAVSRLVSLQLDCDARGRWDGGTFVLESTIDREALISFFLDRYRPTPIVAPWNGGSGFYPKDNKEGINAIAESTSDRFAVYREVIADCRAMEVVKRGPIEKDAKAEAERRSDILRVCRNALPDSAVEWFDAAIGISSEGARAFAPILGTGGNEGRLDYTNNFMSRLNALLISPAKKTPVKSLLEGALFGDPTEMLDVAPSGQYHPGRAGGANQGEGISTDVLTNLWDFVLLMEGAVAWASGLYRRHGVSYRSFLCSPFTVKASPVGYGSSSAGDDARAEIWAPLWDRPARYAELQVLLREGRASVDGRAAETGLQFAEAATSLGVDRSITRFVRYSLLKRRGDSYVALPAGSFPAGYRTESDRIRELSSLLTAAEWGGLPKGCESLRRQVDQAMFEALLRGGKHRVRNALAATGRLLRRVATTTKDGFPKRFLEGEKWLEFCDAQVVEVRIAAALASLYDKEALSIKDNLTFGSQEFCWQGRDLSDRLLSVLDRRLRRYSYGDTSRPFSSPIRLHSGDATPFIEGSTDDDLIEDLLFAFASMRWRSKQEREERSAKVLPIYSALKFLFLPHRVSIQGDRRWIPADQRIPALLRRDDLSGAARIAIGKLSIAGLNPVKGTYWGGVNGVRLGAALLIPATRALSSGILHRETKTRETTA